MSRIQKMILNLLRAERIFVNSRIVHSTFKRVKGAIGALTKNSITKRGSDPGRSIQVNPGSVGNKVCASNWQWCHRQDPVYIHVKIGAIIGNDQVIPVVRHE